MVIVSVYLALAVLAAAPFGFALSRLLLGRMPPPSPGRPAPHPDHA